MHRLALLLISLSLAAPAGAAPLQLRAPVKEVLEREVAGQPFALDCSYAARGAEGLALPAWRGLGAEVYVKPWVCSAANAARSGSPERTGAALLVLAHEALHVSGITDETAAECAALAEVPRLAARVGTPPARIAAVAAGAAAAHDRLRAAHPQYGPCPEDPRPSP